MAERYYEKIASAITEDSEVVTDPDSYTIRAPAPGPVAVAMRLARRDCQDVVKPHGSGPQSQRARVSRVLGV